MKNPHLTPTELEVLVSLANGEPIKELAFRTNRSPKTLSTHRYNMYMKIGVHNAVDATHFALFHGIISLKSF